MKLRHLLQILLIGTILSTRVGAALGPEADGDAVPIRGEYLDNRAVR